MPSTRRLLRMMAGQIKGPVERQMERQARTDKRIMTQIKNYAALGELIERRQKGDPSLPPMPLDFQEIERRRREGTQRNVSSEGVGKHNAEDAQESTRGGGISRGASEDY